VTNIKQVKHSIGKTPYNVFELESEIRNFCLRKSCL